MSDIVSRPARVQTGIPMLLLGVFGVLGSIAVFVVGISSVDSGSTGLGVTVIILAVLLLLASIVVLVGLYPIQPNTAKVLTLFGDYKGSDTTPGLRWANPLYAKRRISLRVRNFTTEASKVNDANGNPIIVAANKVAPQPRVSHDGDASEPPPQPQARPQP